MSILDFIFGKKKDDSEIRVGDTVLCIDDRNLGDGKGVPPPLVYKQKYLVKGTIKCPSCNSKFIDVGLISISDKHTECNECNNNIPGKNIWWCNVIRFVKSTPEEKSEEIVVEKVKEEPKIKINTKELVKELELSEN